MSSNTRDHCICISHKSLGNKPTCLGLVMWEISQRWLLVSHWTQGALPLSSYSVTSPQLHGSHQMDYMDYIHSAWLLVGITMTCVWKQPDQKEPWEYNKYSKPEALKEQFCVILTFACMFYFISGGMKHFDSLHFCAHKEPLKQHFKSENYNSGQTNCLEFSTYCIQSYGIKNMLWVWMTYIHQLLQSGNLWFWWVDPRTSERSLWPAWDTKTHRW